MKKIIFTFFLLFVFFSPAISKDLYILQDNCVRCHLTSERDTEENSVISWKQSVHYRPDSGCTDCHGGDKFLNLNFKKGHVGTPTASEATAMCGKCHQNEYKAFVYLRSGSTSGKIKCAGSCVTCHGSHRIKKPDGSLINKNNCGKCHTFEKVKQLDNTIKAAQTAILTLEKRIINREQKGFPTETVKSQLETIKTAYASSFHALTTNQLIGYITEQTMDSLKRVDMKMDDSSTFRWVFEGIVVVAFLMICVVLAIYFLISVTKRK